jgi:hypothetical protein
LVAGSNPARGATLYALWKTFLRAPPASCGPITIKFDVTARRGTELLVVTRRTFILSGAAFLISQPALATTMRSAPPNDAVGIVNAIYRGTIEGYDRQRALWLHPRNRRGTLSKALIALWVKADAKTQPGDSGPIDFDVTTNSQGMEVKSFTAKAESQDDKRATIVVTLTPKGEWLRHSPQDNIVRYDFIREGGRWVIDDVRSTTDGKPWSLRDLLTQALKP